MIHADNRIFCHHKSMVSSILELEIMPSLIDQRVDCQSDLTILIVESIDILASLSTGIPWRTRYRMSYDA